MPEPTTTDGTSDVALDETEVAHAASREPEPAAFPTPPDVPSFVRMSVDAAILRKALAYVTRVRPSAERGRRETGFRVSVRGSTAQICSFAKDVMSGAVVPVRDATDGDFVVPCRLVPALLRRAPGDAHIMAIHDGARRVVRHRCAIGACEVPTCSPRDLPATSVTADPNTALVGPRLPAGLLLRALEWATSFTHQRGVDRSDWRVRPEHTVVRLVDASTAGGQDVDGHLLASTPSTYFRFACDAFKGARFSIDGRRMKLLSAFLEESGGDVEIRHTSGWTTLTSDDGTTFGWTPPTDATPRGVMSDARSLCLRLPTAALRTALAFICSGTGTRFLNVYLAYSVERGVAEVCCTDRYGGHGGSPPIPALNVTDGHPGDVRVLIDPERFATVLEDVSGPAVDLRILTLPTTNPDFRDDALITVSETLWIDSRGRVLADGRLVVGPPGAHRCHVTRRMLSLRDPIIPPPVVRIDGEDSNCDDYIDESDDSDQVDEVGDSTDAT